MVEGLNAERAALTSTDRERFVAQGVNAERSFLKSAEVNFPT
jgi:hypothetical protein